MPSALGRTHWCVPVIAICTALTAFGSGFRASTQDWPQTAIKQVGATGAVIAIGPRRGDPELRAYGVRRASGGEAVDTTDRFPLASLSKPITAAAVTKLAGGDGVIELDAPLALLFPSMADAPDPRHAAITPRHLLQHAGGWDRAASFEPLLEHDQRAARLPALSPTDCGPIADALLDEPLQFEPGTDYAYSNLGYCWLGRLIEAVTGERYAAAVQRLILAPSGAEELEIGQDAGPALVGHKDGRPLPSPPEHHYAILGAAGGWTGDALSVWRALDTAPDGYAQPLPGEGPAHWYGMGWRIWPNLGGERAETHYGAMPGVFTVAVRTKTGLGVALFNGRPEDDWAMFLTIAQRLLDEINALPAG